MRAAPLPSRPGAVTPRAAWAIRRVVRPWVRALHRPSITGLEHLPEGPFLWVANHSAGIALAEIGALMDLWLDAHDPPRPLAGFAHPLGMTIWPASAVLHAVGAVPSTYAAARATLAAGVPLLVFPGGDHEAFRPLWRAHHVDFGGRLGFLRIAREAGVPVVPLGIRGSHFTAPILWRSRHVLPRLLVLPALLGLKRFPLTLLGLAGAVASFALTPWSPPVKVVAAWAALCSPVTFLPVVPATLRLRSGRPISPDALFDPTLGEEESLRAALRRVEAEVQALVSAPDGAA